MKLNKNYIALSCNAITYNEYIKEEGFDYTILPDNPSSEDIQLCKGKNLIPLYRNVNGILVVGYLDDVDFQHQKVEGVKEIKISFADFKERYTKYYGKHPQFNSIPVKDYANLIIKFALENKAADISTFVDEGYIKTFLNAKGRKIWCNVEVPLSLQREFILALTNVDINTRPHNEPIYMDKKLDNTHMGRCVVGFTNPNETAATIRIADSSVFDLTIEKLNLSPEVYKFLKEKFADSRGGLRLVVGKTMSGKNTTILSVLKDFIKEDKYKIISIESPVERKLPGVIQFNCKTPEEVKANARALIRENPDVVYFAETTDAIAEDVLTSSNTGARVISTTHTNSCEDSLFRMKDMTGRPIDEIIRVFHSVLFQRLVWDEEIKNYRPKCQFVDFTNELKLQLYGKSPEEISRIIKENTHGDNDLF